MTLGNIRALGVERLLVSCLNQSLWAHARDIRRPVLLRNYRSPRFSKHCQYWPPQPMKPTTN
jgi:hypothetical protein